MKADCGIPMIWIWAVSTVAEEEVGVADGDAPDVRVVEGVPLMLEVNELVAVDDPDTVDVGVGVLKPVPEPVFVTVGDAVPVLLPVTDKLADGVCDVVMYGVLKRDKVDEGDADTVDVGVYEADTVLVTVDV